MKVLMLSKAMVVGSYQRKAEWLAELGGAGLELVVAAPPQWRDGTLVRRLERMHERGYRLVETPIRRSGDFHLHWYPGLGQLIERERPDLVHVDEEPYNLATWLALRAARRVGARTLFFTWQNLARRYPPPFRWFEQAAYGWVGGAIAGSQTAGAVLREKGYGGPLWVIPQVGVDEVTYRPPEPDPRRGADRMKATGTASMPSVASTGELERPLRIGYAGRLVEAKGVDLLLDALASPIVTGLAGEMSAEDGVEQGGASWQLVVLGEGSERAALEARAEALGIAGRVEWRSWLPSSEMPGFYRGLDLLVLPSRSTPSWIEQFGRVLTEAMACGVVCVGSDSGEIPHVIGEAGRVFPEGDAAALARCLAELIEDGDLRDRLAEAGRRRVLERFTMRAVAEKTIEAYERVMA